MKPVNAANTAGQMLHRLGARFRTLASVDPDEDDTLALEGEAGSLPTGILPTLPQDAGRATTTPKDPS